MQAQRKLADPAPTASPAEPASVEPVDFELPPLDNGALPTSPAIMLQAQLAARLATPHGGTLVGGDVAEAREYKLPMPLRVVTIVALSLALWGGIVLTAVKVVT